MLATIYLTEVDPSSELTKAFLGIASGLVTTGGGGYFSIAIFDLGRSKKTAARFHRLRQAARNRRPPDDKEIFRQTNNLEELFMRAGK